MTEPGNNTEPGRASATRRQFLLGGAVAGAGAVAAVGIDAALAARPSSIQQTGSELHGFDTVPFFGAHQAGIETDAQAHVAIVALDLHKDTDRDALRRLMRILTDDAARLTQGVAALADSEPELAIAPARLTVTFGFGPEFVERAHGVLPHWLRPLPPFAIDQLQPKYSAGDLMLQLASDDPLTIAHATRMLLKDCRSFGTVRWSQTGFRRAHGTVKPGTTMRNLFGQVDGTTNVTPGTQEFDRVVWCNEGWMAGGTSMVIRRTSMNLDKWDRLDRAGRDQAIGRYQSNGAPLTSNPVDAAAEFDEPDFEAKNASGFPVIPAFSHIARARPQHAGEQIFRRSYNYDEPSPGASVSNSGLIFVSFQADVDAQFTPIQRRLAELDLLNEWTTPIGSAVFAIPPGCAEGGYIGETLLE